MSLNNYGNRWLIGCLKGDYDMEINNIAYCCGVINSYYRRIYRKIFHRYVQLRDLWTWLACGGRYDFLNIECRIGEIRVLILVLCLHRTDT